MKTEREIKEMINDLRSGDGTESYQDCQRIEVLQWVLGEKKHLKEKPSFRFEDKT